MTRPNDSDPVETRLKWTIAVVLDLDAAQLGDDASSETIPAWDSVKQMDIVLAVESEFDVRFTDAAIPNLTSYRILRQELAALGAA
ncbi:MAG TPA: acyl carrier protein [Caulobacteraceae bacterium]|nr:acyl carrier protein [Caulobacteraceae bacterium]